MSNFYIPEGIADEYKYIVPSNDYYDIYNTNYLNPNETYNYYRFYYGLDEDMFVQMQRQTSQYNYGYLTNSIEVTPKHSYIYRRDYPQILQTVFFLTVGFVLLINILTSIIKKGGVLSGLL